MLKYIIAFSLGVYIGQEYTKLPKIKDQVEKSIKDIKDYFDKLK